jgi:hypothetical protein
VSQVFFAISDTPSYGLFLTVKLSIDILEYADDMDKLSKLLFGKKYRSMAGHLFLDNSVPHVVTDRLDRPIIWHIPNFLKTKSQALILC